MRILQAANLIAPGSGGLRTTLDALAYGYRAAGHDVVRLLPGSRSGVEVGSNVPLVRVSSPRVPGLGGYRIIRPGPRLDRVLERLRPDRIEVSDRATLHRIGRWGVRNGVPTVLIVHERLDALLSLWLPGRRLLCVAADD